MRGRPASAGIHQAVLIEVLAVAIVSIVALACALMYFGFSALGTILLAAFALVGLVGVGLLLETGDRGGRLVFQHGVGTARD